MKHLFGDRPESVPRPQRAQHTHIGARGGGHSGTQPLCAAGAQPLRAQRAIFFQKAPPQRIFLRILAHAGLSVLQVLEAMRAASKPGRAASVQAHTRRAQRPKKFEEELLKGVFATFRRSPVSMEWPHEHT